MNQKTIAKCPEFFSGATERNRRGSLEKGLGFLVYRYAKKIVRRRIPDIELYVWGYGSYVHQFRRPQGLLLLGGLRPERRLPQLLERFGGVDLQPGGNFATLESNCTDPHFGGPPARIPRKDCTLAVLQGVRWKFENVR